jgi:hypothetical protein
MVTISETNFPDLDCILYVHDILHDCASLILGDLAPFWQTWGWSQFLSTIYCGLIGTS